MPNGQAQAPIRQEPTGWEHFLLWQRVREAVRAVPAYFKTATVIEGMLAPDIFTLNAALGATIEDQVVRTLNEMRPLWDPEKQYQSYSFIRQPQVFPDVLLRRRTNGQEILMGIELKGWYLLAKEGMPNFRFTVNQAACTDRELLVVVPWVLSNVLAGSPVVFRPFIELARYAAEKRNFYWQHERQTVDDPGIIPAGGVTPYPKKTDRISDRAVSDAGKNFGRIARYGLMDDYLREIKDLNIQGISADEWLTFFKKFAKSGD